MVQYQCPTGDRREAVCGWRRKASTATCPTGSSLSSGPAVGAFPPSLQPALPNLPNDLETAQPYHPLPHPLRPASTCFRPLNPTAFPPPTPCADARSRGLSANDPRPTQPKIPPLHLIRARVGLHGLPSLVGRLPDAGFTSAVWPAGERFLADGGRERDGAQGPTGIVLARKKAPVLPMLSRGVEIAL
eukprot:scaffold17694_cov118-Isochrysis_galbana.AAC.1